jgi:hypothetical protein
MLFMDTRFLRKNPHESSNPPLKFPGVLWTKDFYELDMGSDRLPLSGTLPISFEL